MKIFPVLLPCLGCLAVISNSRAADLKQSRVTQVVNDVQIISAASQQEKSATVNDVFSMPDILRTGPASRAELVAADETVTRVGSDTIFSFDPASRTIDLKQGSLLFHSPHGKGGGSIHTGSATASVLGSTLIVTATPNGGFKVISLEDGTDIKLPNGSHQHLEPGQLTFILPGNGQLAPIVLFRLDDLIQHSLLVGGFAHTLSSLPLIVNEINHQDKLIKSGRLTDTGLLAGDNANVNQVEVLDPNTVQSTVDSDNIKNALGTDATINQPSLADPTIPIPPARIFLNPAFTLPGNSFYSGQTFRGFAARNLAFNTTGGNSASLGVDLSGYASQPEFDFVAAKNINLAGSVTFNGLSAANHLALVAGNQMTFAPGISLIANVGNFSLSSPEAMTLNNVSIFNNVGTIHLASGSTISLNDGNIQTVHLILTAPKAINLTFNAALNIGPPGDNTFNTDAGSGSVNLTSLTSSLTVTDTSIQAHYLTLNSGDSILLDCSGHTLTTTGAGATANFTAPNLVTVNNADFSGWGVMNVVSQTAVFVHDALAIITNVGTKTGGAQINGPVEFGKLNLINCSWQGQQITSTSQINFSSGPGSTPGIYSYANH